MSSGPLKVLEISSYPPPLAGWGMRVYIIKKELEKRGDICEVLNIGKGRFLTDRDFVPVLSGWDYVKKVFGFRLRGYLVHMHMNGDSPKGFILTLLALSISTLTFRRPVLTFHAGPVQKYFPQSRAPRLTLMYKIIFGLPRHIICNSTVEKAAIQGYGIRPEKIMPIQAFTRQYLEFDQARLPERIDTFFARFPLTFCTYVFYRPQFFIPEMVAAVAAVLEKRPQAGLVIMGPDRDTAPILDLCRKHGIASRVFMAGNQEHDAFLEIMRRSKLYLRTQVKDGVCSSVLEALSLGVPVVAVENGTRPESTITYENLDIDEMVEKLLYVLDHHAAVCASIKKPEIRDTARDELAILAQEGPRDARPAVRSAAQVHAEPASMAAGSSDSGGL